MQNFEEKLFELGVGTWVMDVITQIPVNASTEFNIGQTLPKNVGFIYGISTYADQVDPQGVALPTTTQMQNLYITLQNGPTQFFSQVAMSDFLNVLQLPGIALQVRNTKYTPVAIPSFDLSTSFYQNPSSIVGPVNIRLKLWYIQLIDWNRIKGQMEMHHKANEIKNHEIKAKHASLSKK